MRSGSCTASDLIVYSSLHRSRSYVGMTIAGNVRVFGVHASHTLCSAEDTVVDIVVVDIIVVDFVVVAIIVVDIIVDGDTLYIIGVIAALAFSPMVAIVVVLVVIDPVVAFVVVSLVVVCVMVLVVGLVVVLVVSLVVVFSVVVVVGGAIVLVVKVIVVVTGRTTLSCVVDGRGAIMRLRSC